MGEDPLAARNQSGSIRFGAFELRPDAGELYKHGSRLKLTGQAIEVLSMLLERPGQLVTREELKKKLWSDAEFGDFEHGLNAVINRLRETLGDSATEPRYIETVPRRGYRSIAVIESDESVKPQVDGGAAPASIKDLPSPKRDRVRQVLLWTGFSALCLLVGFSVVWQLSYKRSAHEQRVILAVLPFQNLSGDPAQEYFDDGLTEETITELAQVSPEKLGLIARRSAMAYRGTAKTVAQIGSELGVNYVLEGSVRRGVQNVRVSVQLIRVRDQTHVWAHSYEREIRNLLALERDLGEDIAEQIEVQLASNARSQLAKQRTIDPEAHEAYLKGRHFWSQFRFDSLNQAITFYQQALEKDSQYAAAYAGLAAAYTVRGNFFGKPSEDFARAREAAERALKLDDTLAEAHEAMAAVHIFYDWDWAAADKELKRCEELGGTSGAHNLRAYWYEARGDTASAISVLKRGLRLDPFNPLLNADLGFAYYYARQPDGLIAQYQPTKEADPTFGLADVMPAMAYEEKGDLNAAAAEYRRLGDLAGVAVIQAKQGDVRAARELLDKMRKNSKSPNPSTMASLCHALGDKDCTFTWLEKKYADRHHGLIWLRVNPEYDDLRSDIRFQRLCDRIGLQ